MALTILDRLDQFPPMLCRYVARTRDGRRGLSHAELAKKSGLNIGTVQELSFRTSWKGYSIDAVDAFSRACGVNHLANKRQKDFLKRRQLVHVSTATGNQKRMYDRIESLIIRAAQTLPTRK